MGGEKREIYPDNGRHAEIMEKIMKKICSGVGKGNCKVQAWIKRGYGPDDLDVE